MEAEATTDEGLSPLLQSIITPISPGSPAGEDITYDDDFQRLKAEIDSMASATGGGVDFEMVAEVGRKVLANKSKDLRVACYLAMALDRTQGLKGISEGLAAVELMTKTFWEDMYPPKRRMAGRQNALQSLSDRLKERIAEIKPAEGDRETLESTLERIRSLQAFCMEAMAEQAPALSGLVQALEDTLRRVPKPAPSPSAATTASTPASAPLGTPQAPPQVLRVTPQPAAATSAGADTGELTPQVIERSLLRFADFLREKDPSDPAPYRLVRAYRWSALRSEPANENGKTRLEGPPAQKLTFLSGLLERGEHAKLLAEAENSFHEYRFWIDTQRLLVSAMDALGAPYQAARDAVLFETALFLKRIPRISKLTFADGMPFADAMTQSWIEMRVMPVFSSGEADGPASANGQSGLDARYKEARQKLGSGDLTGALGIMRDETDSDGSLAERFRRRMYVASLCVSGGKPAVARPLLESLDEEIDRRGLAEWDPSLALEVWSNLFRCYTHLGAGVKGADGEELRRGADRVFQKVCRIDVERALTLQA